MQDQAEQQHLSNPLIRYVALTKVKTPNLQMLPSIRKLYIEIDVYNPYIRSDVPFIDCHGYIACEAHVQINLV